MAEDLRRFLADEPIKARQVSTSERYWRWARRNPVIAVLGGVLTGLLVAVTVGSMVAASYFRNLAGSESFAKRAVAARPQGRHQGQAPGDRRARSLASAFGGPGARKGNRPGRGKAGPITVCSGCSRPSRPRPTMRRHSGKRFAGTWVPGSGRSISPSGSVRASVSALTSASAPTARRLPRVSVRAIVTARRPSVIWDTASGAKLKTLDGALAPFAFRTDSKVLFAVAEPRGVLAIELATERVLWRTMALPGEFPSEIDLSSDGSTVLADRTKRESGNELVDSTGCGHGPAAWRAT